MAAAIISAYVTRNAVPAVELPALIASVYGSLMKVPFGAHAVEASAPLVPPVSIKKSITVEDGKKFQTLTRHLFSKYDMTPAQYRAKWGLPHDYPMVAPAYAAKRSALAKDIGLGASRGSKTTAKVSKKKAV